jgi:DivIVA domain-containing protein
VDREAIERRDFPVGRRGYDPEAVDSHLRRVADEFETLRGQTPKAPATTPLAAGASEQVRLILEAAEASAAELKADAGRQASEHVAGVQQAAGSMLSRLDELERELGALLDALRQSGERLNEGLAKLHRQAGEIGDELAPSEPAAEETAAAPAPDESAPDEIVSVPGPPEEAASEPPAADANGGPASDDEAAARLIALNMALSGSPREETAAYLAEHYTLADPDALLDDVYDRAGR